MTAPLTASAAEARALVSLAAEARALRRVVRLALPHLVESVESIVRGHSTAYEWESE